MNHPGDGPGDLLPKPFRCLPVRRSAPARRLHGTSELVYTGEPATSDVVVAGNPFAYLRLTSNQPGGIFSVALVDVGS